MGCCVSSNNNKLPPTISNSSQQSEEETVKEVLSETPTTIQKPNLYTNENSPKISSTISKFSNNTMKEKHHNKYLSEEVSEICSSTLSETEKQYVPENDVQRSPAKYRNNRSVGSSPARISDPSPGRVRSGSGSGSGRDCRGPRKDNGECSGRRSRSPGMRTENGGYGSGLGRSPSVRKTGKSTGRVRSELGDRIRKMDERDYYYGNNNGENKKWPPPTNGNESLENPLVSLECFIFL
ncbi:hypothetical protein RND71_020025 [Anisodus tanguticus]|uniref:Uncharacterized protein n=1 Tax=Anisodus tanguticus TaxID=243964 RepID=A0AAE1V8Z7_9SOLA|nr:hypothetical protein RND71_020025 [Anisodus tanguticus]